MTSRIAPAFSWPARERQLAAAAWLAFLLAPWAYPSTAQDASQPSRPNFVVIVIDDLGYGDLGCYGNPEIRTPAFDRIAAEGVRLTEFYTPAPTCSPARAALLTGRHPLRTGVTRTIIPKEMQGLPAAEITLAEHLRSAGYATACVGKWHLGGRKQHRPQRHGFDEFYGVLYSNNMVWLRRLQWPRIELIDGWRAIESPADQALLTRRYTHRARKVLARHWDRPFLLYLAYTMPHLPLAASAEFAGRSGKGLYADVIEELDASVGQIVSDLASNGLESNTYLFVTSDNGPWTGDREQRGGSTGGLRGFKGTTWEGGLRVPFLARAPGRLPAGAVRSGPVTLEDIFPTVSGLAGVPVPADRTLDGRDISPLLRGEGAAPDRYLYFSHRRKVTAVRSGRWKLHLRERAPDKKGRARKSRVLDPPQLYRMDTDPSEQHDMAASEPDVVDRLRRSAESYAERIEPTVKLRPFGQALVRGLLTPKP